MQYTFRRSVIEGDTTCVLDERGIHSSAQGRAECFISYRGIARISLRYSPTRFFTNRYTCTVHSNDGRKLEIQNNSFEKIGRFLDLSAAYRVFVTELHERTKSIKGIRFSGGDTPLRYVLYSVLTVFAVVLVAFVLLAFGPGPGVLIIVRLLFIAFLLIYSIRHLRQNRPRRYDPASIPKDLLPRVASMPAASAANKKEDGTWQS